MKVFVLVLLVALLFVERAHALMCFTCNMKKSSVNCMKISYCAIDENYCLSEVISSTVAPKQKNITKSCSSTCPGSGYTSGDFVVTIQCCQHTLCNIFSNDGGLQGSSLVLGLSVLFSLLYTLVRPGA
ncbi:lymphocyte antigen 6E-like [Vombatus ursinus]|uniref:lymphocyte antigen 6E-like n=1 Tax=Vombatus ursinus TaxID=29139 RepID=UPI000FFCFC34|nr:lymphocyte antigen 6E-like [Vombatus ursinus]